MRGSKASNVSLLMFSIVLSLGLAPRVRASLAVVQKQVFTEVESGYGRAGWGKMTVAIDAAMNNDVTVVPVIGNLNEMRAYDALWIDTPDPGTSPLTAAELFNLSAFIGTGRRVVFMGDNASLTAWDNQVLGILGGGFDGETGWVYTYKVLDHQLTEGVGSVRAISAGLTTGGTPLFDINWATLWRGNVLTLLDANALDNHGWRQDADNAQFARNVASWVPEPTTAILFALGALGSVRKRRTGLHGDSVNMK